MTSPARSSQAAGIAGFAFLACALIPLLALASTQFRIYAPIARDWLCATLTPEFGMGVVFALACIGLVALVAVWKRP